MNPSHTTQPAATEWLPATTWPVTAPQGPAGYQRPRVVGLAVPPVPGIARHELGEVFHSVGSGLIVGAVMVAFVGPSNQRQSAVMVGSVGIVACLLGGVFKSPAHPPMHQQPDLAPPEMARGSTASSIAGNGGPAASNHP